jgi:N-acetylmuramoyl-L-alanine amidase
VPFVARSEWSNEPPGEGFVPHEVVAITVHHTAVVLTDPGAGAQRARSHQRGHIARGWPDLAYHFLIDGEGSVFEGRPTSARGDTGTNYDPTGYLLVTLEGNFEEQDPTATQLDALVAVLAWGSAEYSVPPADISGHRDHAATLCPGRTVHELLHSGEIARRVQLLLDSGGVRLESGAAGSDGSAPGMYSQPVTRCRVAVDAGHTRDRPGATSAAGRPEWGFNRRLAGELVDALPDAFLVDPADEGLPLRDRPAVARDRGADLLVSIHHDSVQPHYLQTEAVDGAERRSSTRFRGHSLFVSALGTEPTASERLGRAVGAALVAAGFVPTKHHAEPIEGENRPWVDEDIGLHRYDGLAVLRASELPSLLIEAGVLVHPGEEADLERPDYRRRLVDAIGAGTAAFCSAERP